MDDYRDLHKGERGAWLGIGAYIVLAAVKLWIGLWTHSEALRADGLNNLTDIFASFAVVVGLRISRKPPDENHPYGHLRAETIASLAASFIMAVVALQVIWTALSAWMQSGGQTPPNLWAAWTALASSAVLWGVYRYNRRLAKAINSSALLAAAKDNRSDSWVGLGAAVGVFGSQWGLPWLDPLAALLVGCLILRTAWSIFTEAVHALSDGFDERKLEHYRKTAAGSPGVHDVKELRARKHGNRVLVDITIEVNPSLNVVESHQISDDVERRMKREHHIGHVHVHIEPGT